MQTFSQHEFLAYTALRIILYTGCIALGVFVSGKFFFPSQPALYDFIEKKSEKSPQGFVRKDLQLQGEIRKEKPLTLDVETLKRYAKGTVQITLDDTTDTAVQLFISVRRGYKAFFFPKNLSGEQYNDTVSADRIVRIGEKYYALSENALTPFISEQALRSQYPNLPIEEESESFFENRTVQEPPIGFKNGSLLASEDTVFIVENTNAYPIANVPTFESFGLKWENIIQANSEEIGMYKKGHQFTVLDPHVEGTLFSVEDQLWKVHNYSMLPESREDIAPEIISSAISVNPKSATQTVTCTAKIKENLFGEKRASCTVNIELLNDLPGNDYLFEIAASSPELQKNIRVSKVEITLFQDISWNNLHVVLSQIKQMIAGRK